jgi:NAD+ diphosphatase
VSELRTWKHCPRCGQQLEHDESKVECANCGFRHHAHSQVTACAIVVDDRGRVLLSRRKSEPFADRWDLPGGFVGEGEHPLDAVKRELQEETGLEIEPQDLVGIWMDRYSEDGSGPATLNMYWTARAGGTDARPADDVSELRWASPDEWPGRDEFAFHIADVLDAWRQQHA